MRVSVAENERQRPSNCKTDGRNKFVKPLIRAIFGASARIVHQCVIHDLVIRSLFRMDGINVALAGNGRP
jgi:hypothetical protein